VIGEAAHSNDIATASDNPPCTALGEMLTAQLNSNHRHSVYAVMGSGGKDKKITAAQLDYYLWKTAVHMDGTGELANFPFHRTRTTDY
jgi:hypothetical protein